MPVSSTPEDKVKIVFHAAMMSLQNFGFFIMYFELWGAVPVIKVADDAIAGATDDVCSDLRAAFGLMSLTCFCVAFLCVGMGFGGYTDDKLVFTLYWMLHLVGGACYTVATITVPMAIFSDDGETCYELMAEGGGRMKGVFALHAALYMVYVGSMLSITYFSFVKPTYFKKIGTPVASQ